jgi:hypothetical protein
LHFFALLLRFVLFILPALFVLYFSVEFRLVFFCKFQQKSSKK